MDFKEFQLDSRIEAAIRTAGFTAPTPVQVQTIGRVMQGQDLIGLAQTGTGKTAAYVLPLLHRLLQSKNRKNRALILAPTRELAEQIHQDIQTLGRRTGLKSLTLYGGAAIGPQIQALKKGVDIVVACPGRLIDHINRGNMDFSGLETLVLDEADQMLDMGFIPDIRRILKKIPRGRQSLMFSATMRKEIRLLADEVLHKPAFVQVGEPAAADTVSHTHFPVSQNQKTSLLLKILKDTRIASVLIFTRTKHRAKRLSEALERAGYGAASLQGNLSQNRRQAALNGFKSGKYQILVATDIASRGIDVSGVSHVVNYDVPATAEAYIHRIGRTGRAEHTGSAFNLVTNEDRQVLKSIDRVVGSLIERRTFADFDYAVSAPGAKTPSKPQKQTRRPGSGFHKSR
ncbi:ATP-dependent RNA helicase RhlE [Desulfosalsimonas propionicica]|uniref:DEAD-box ATP-dependent RNA helicase RhpA n=1 Tax=Desulfosalsimonas propionicica TaxID=332175 RepID=A0A7W0C8G0_9BACT|nr:DEAD/DEAH box helicase [Desulfosalsimonas propionicica]MBA2881114.1 ATP-dependent RNA helicase RhlE [Desulfosalsimonas propionicica]